MHWFKNFKKKSPPGVLLSSKHRASSSYTSITKLQSEQHLPFFKDGTTICCSGLPWIDCSSGWMLDLWTSCPNLHSSWGYSLVPQRPIFLLTILSSSFSSPPPPILIPEQAAALSEAFPFSFLSFAPHTDECNSSFKAHFALLLWNPSDFPTGSDVSFCALLKALIIVSLSQGSGFSLWATVDDLLGLWLPWLLGSAESRSFAFPVCSQWGAW